MRTWHARYVLLTVICPSRKMEQNNLWRGIVLCVLLMATAGHGAAISLAAASERAVDTPSAQDNEACAILNAEGLVFYRRGQYTEALEQLQKAASCFQQVSDRVGEGEALNNIGDVYKSQGNYGMALKYYFWAELIFENEKGEEARLGTVRSNIGEVYLRQGRPDEAQEYFGKSLESYKTAKDLIGEGVTLGNIGTAYERKGDYEKALEYFDKALRIQVERGNQPGEAIVRGNIGQIYRAQKRYREALDMYRQARAIFREQRYRTEEATALNCIGDVYLDLRRYTEALEKYQEARTIYHEVGNQLEEAVTLHNIGLVYHVQEADSKALNSYQQAIGILERLRPISGSEVGKMAFIAQFAGLYTHAVSLCYQHGWKEEAFLITEQSRARAFLDSLATGHVELTDNEAAVLLAQEQEAYASRQTVQDAMYRARALESPDPSLVTNLEKQLKEAEDNYQITLAAIKARGDQLAALVPGGSTVLGISEVQSLLDEETTLVSYFVQNDQTMVFLITHSNFEIIPIYIPRQELVERIWFLRNVIPSRDQAATLPAAQELYQLLIAPLSASLHTPHLAIIPHGPLHYLPFAALVDAHTGQPLLERYTLTTLPSASALKYIQQNRVSGAGSPLILGNPATGDPTLDPLPFAEQEAQSVAALYGVRPLLGEAATESTVQKRASQASILHLAAHGNYNPYNPLYSVIRLAPDKDAGDDGKLEVHQVYGLDLKNTDLVVLSACQTQLSQLKSEDELAATVSAGDEIVGLTRAFFFAGTPTVIATLWSVDDEATAKLMERFYIHLREGMGKAEALRRAQREVRADPEHPQWTHPYYWAGFVLSGDWGKISESELPLQTPTAEPVPTLSPSHAPSIGTHWPFPYVLLAVIPVAVLVIVISRRWQRRRGSSRIISHQ